MRSYEKQRKKIPCAVITIVKILFSAIVLFLSKWSLLWLIIFCSCYYRNIMQIYKGKALKYSCSWISVDSWKKKIKMRFHSAEIRIMVIPLPAIHSHGRPISGSITFPRDVHSSGMRRRVSRMKKHWKRFYYGYGLSIRELIRASRVEKTVCLIIRVGFRVTHLSTLTILPYLNLLGFSCSLRTRDLFSKRCLIYKKRFAHKEDALFLKSWFAW